MRFSAALLTLTVLLAGPAAAAADPTIARLSPAVQRAFGDARGDYFHPATSTWRQVVEGLAAPRDPEQRLGDGDRLVAGCARKPCRERAAVVLNARGRVVAAGMIHFHCQPPAPQSFRRRAAPPRCSQARTLSIFLVPSPKRGAYEAELTAWSRRHGGYDLKSIMTLDAAG